MYFLFKGGGGGAFQKITLMRGGQEEKNRKLGGGGGGHTIFKLHSSKFHQPPLPHKKWTVPNADQIKPLIQRTPTGKLSTVACFKTL